MPSANAVVSPAGGKFCGKDISLYRTIFTEKFSVALRDAKNTRRNPLNVFKLERWNELNRRDFARTRNQRILPPRPRQCRDVPHGASSGRGGRAPCDTHEVDDARRDLGAEARAVEHAVVADAGLHVVGVLVRRKVAAQVVRRVGLADARRCRRSRPRPSSARRVGSRRDRSAWPRCVISPFGSAWLHEHGVDGLQVEFGGQVHHRQVLVVELAVLLRRNRRRPRPDA